jgi:hypothetical protein
VELSGAAEAPVIDIFFRWGPQPDLFGISYPVGAPRSGSDSAPDAYIAVYVEEDLLATGFGVTNAHRVAGEGVTWLNWPSSGALKH